MVRYLFPSLRIGGQYAHDLKAARTQIMRERKAVAAGELDSYEDLLLERTFRTLENKAYRSIEALSRGRAAEWLGIAVAARPNDEAVSELAGVDADDGGSTLGALPLGK